MPRLVEPVISPGAFRDRAQPSLVADEDERLALRPWSYDDVPVLVDAYADSAIQHWHHRTMTEHEARRWIVETAASWYRETDAEWAVAIEGRAVGRVALRSVELSIGQAQVSYWTAPSARSRGVARRSVDRVARWALDEVGFQRLSLTHSTGNGGSCRVAERAGFGFEATLRQAHLHADGWHDVHVHTRFD